MQFPHELFKTAGMNSTDVAVLFGVSRVTGYRWLNGDTRTGKPSVINVLLRPAVEKMVPRVQLAIASGVLPDPALTKLVPIKRAEKIKSIIKRQRATK